MMKLRMTVGPRVAAGLLAAVVPFFLGSASLAQAKKPKLLVQDLAARGATPSEAAALSTAACSSVARRKGHEVLCGDDLRNLMQFGALAAALDGCEGDACQASIGKALDARFIVSGSVAKLGTLYVLSLSMFDTEAGKVQGRGQVKAATIEKLHVAVDEAVSELFKAPSK